MEQDRLKRSIEFLEYFGVDTKGDTIYLTSGGNSLIINPNTQWKEYLGYSINSVAEYVAKRLGKTTEWID